MSYWIAYRIVVITTSLGYISERFLTLSAVSFPLSLALALTLGAYLFGTLIKKNNGEPIGFFPGLKIEVVLSVLYIAVVALIGLGAASWQSAGDDSKARLVKKLNKVEKHNQTKL